MSALKDFFTDLRQRKLTRTLLAYGAVGWAILEGIERYGTFLPDIVENVAPILFIAGIPYCLILGWFHGEKGRQRVGLAEASLLGLATVGAVAFLWLASPFGVAEGSGSDEGEDLYRIGVLSFESLGGEEGDLAGFAAGLSRELSRTLAQVDALEVPPDWAVSPYRQGGASPDSIARALGVSLLVAGSVARAGDSVVVTPVLSEATSEGETLWSGRFVEPVEGAWDWALIERITGDLAAALRAELGSQIRLRRWEAETDSHQAWQLLQRARRQWDVAWQAFLRGEGPYAAEMMARADSLLGEVARLDEEWTEPHLLRAELSERRAVVGRFFPGRNPAGGPEAMLREGLEHVDRALERDPRSARAWELRGTLAMLRLSSATPADFEAFRRIEEDAMADLRRAVEIDPFLASAWSKLASLHLARGEFGEARSAAETAQREDAFLERPLETYLTLADASFQLGEDARALALVREGQGRFPGTALPELELEILAWGSRVSADVERAWELVALIESEPSATIQGGLPPVLQTKAAGVLARAGLADSARAVLARAERAAPADSRVLRRRVAVLARLGETERALELLERVLEAYPAGPERLLARRMFDPLRGHPRFEALLEPDR